MPLCRICSAELGRFSPLMGFEEKKQVILLRWSIVFPSLFLPTLMARNCNQLEHHVARGV